MSEGSFAPFRLRLHWRTWLRSPLLISLLLAVIVRVWLVVHTHGVIAGDEAMVGMQAEHILRGERPIYYYGQPYMGSLEAYMMALLFLIAGGPSVWMMRATSLSVSLGLVVLTWAFSSALSEAARLPARARQIFRIVAALVAALPPLYATVTELRTWGGYIEAFVVMLWLLFAAFRLTQRWQADARAREMMLRWAGVGLLIGLGFWIDPLTIYAVLAVAFWIGGFCVKRIVVCLQKGTLRLRRAILRGFLSAVAALLASLLGSAPALIWGLQHQWKNVTYALHNGNAVPANRFPIIGSVTRLYVTCIAPHVVGGALYTQPDVSQAHPHILTFGLFIAIICLLVALASLCSLVWPQPVLVQVRKLTSLPLLFGLCASIIFCTSSIAAVSLYAGCGSLDLTGRYVVPLVVALPFVVAAAFTLPWLSRGEMITTTDADSDGSVKRKLGGRVWPVNIARAGTYVLLVIYLVIQFYPYVTSNAGYTFQTSGCVMEPADDRPLIHYLQQAHIRYAWATGWIGDPITFRTDGAIIVAEPGGRIAADGNAVQHADRPSIIQVVRWNDAHPPLLRLLDSEHIAYRVARFPSEPGYHVLVMTPLTRTVSPFGPDPHGVFKPLFDGC